MVQIVSFISDPTKLSQQDTSTPYTSLKPTSTEDIIITTNFSYTTYSNKQQRSQATSAAET